MHIQHASCDLEACNRQWNRHETGGDFAFYEIYQKICKLATRPVPTGNGICTYEDVISPWIFTSFNEELRDYLGYETYYMAHILWLIFYDFNFRGPKQHYNDTLERLYKVNCIRLLNLIANEPFGWVYNLKIKNESKLRCRMLLDNDFIPELTKRFDFIIAPGAGIVKNRDHWRWIVKFMEKLSLWQCPWIPFKTLQIFVFRIIYCITEFGINQHKLTLDKKLSKDKFLSNKKCPLN